MGIITKEVEVKLTTRNVEYYKNLGYKIPMRQASKSSKKIYHKDFVYDLGKTIVVKVEDLPPGSNVKILVKCDFCDRPPKEIMYFSYIKSIEKYGKYSCTHCIHNKTKLTNLERYGESYRKQFYQKAFKTFYDRTGYNYPSQSPEVREKMIQSYIDNYGVDNPQRSSDIRERTEATNLERYGYIHPSQNEDVKEKIRITNLQKYGYEYTSQVPEVRQKMNETLCKNGAHKTSKQQLYLHSLYGGEINYPIKYYASDICFPEEKLCVEYDGGGHRLRVMLGKQTNEEFDKKEIARNKVIKREGYKQMRLISSKDLLPSDEILLQMLEKTKEYFSNYPNHSWIEFNIDSSSIRNAEQKEGIFFDCGDLRRIKESDVNNIQITSETDCA